MLDNRLCSGTLSVWSQWIAFTKTLFIHAESTCSLTFPFMFGTKTELLHHSNDSLTPNGTIICCFSSCLGSSAMHKLLFLVVPGMSVILYSVGINSNITYLTKCMNSDILEYMKF